MSITSLLEDAVSGILGTTPQVVGGGPNAVRPITLADASKLIQAGMTMQQLTALGYVIVS